MVKAGSAKDGKVQTKAKSSSQKKAAISAKDDGSSKPSPQRPSPTAVDEDIAVGSVLDKVPAPSSPAKKKAKTSKAAVSTAAEAITEDGKIAKAAPKRRRATSKKAMILEKAASEDADSAALQHTKSPAKKKASSKTPKASSKKKGAKSPNGKSKAAASSSAASDDPKNAKKKRSWTKPKDKPKRPLSAYNLFFRDEREKLLKDSSPPANGESTSSTANGGTSSTHSEGINGTVDPSSDQPAKRRHRKSHGKIGFAQLAQHIAAKWKALDADARKPYEKEAEGEKARYRVELEKWRVAQKAKQEQLLQTPEQAQMDAQEEAALTLQALRANTPPPAGALPQESHALRAVLSSADPPAAALHGEATQMEPI